MCFQNDWGWVCMSLRGFSVCVCVMWERTRVNNSKCVFQEWLCFVCVCVKERAGDSMYSRCHDWGLVCMPVSFCVPEELRGSELSSHERLRVITVCVFVCYLTPLTCTQHMKPSCPLWSLYLFPKGGPGPPEVHQDVRGIAVGFRELSEAVFTQCWLFSLLYH